jgi:hypothetical protein
MLRDRAASESELPQRFATVEALARVLFIGTSWKMEEHLTVSARIVELKRRTGSSNKRI